MKILLTGGAGFIGSHTIVELVAAGHEVVAADNFSNSSPVVFDRLREITGQTIEYRQLDVRDDAALDKLFTDYTFDAVIHFAGCKAVGESVQKPLEYYGNNIGGTIALAQAMRRHNVSALIFSSTAALHGQPDAVPVTEDAELRPTNPYSRSKAMCEQVLRDAAAANPALRVTLLRYFNPVGAHPSGLIGEDPNGIPNNLTPYISQVAVGKRPYLQVFGDDYDTPDGTGIRDYIHVVDVARGHVAALEHLAEPGTAAVFNLGAGVGYSVLQMVEAYHRASGAEIPYKITARRPGDIDYYYADVGKAKAELGWQATHTLDDMCRDAWNWQSKNPNGYKHEADPV